MRRIIEADIQDFLLRRTAQKNVLLLEGARQVGKTFCVNTVLDSIKNRPVIRINLERDRLLLEEIDQCDEFADFEYLLTRTYGFKNQADAIIFIDEAQESEKIGGFVRFMKEEWSKTSVILTGSSMSRLFRNNRVPVGRVEYLRLYGYSFREFLRRAGHEDLLADPYEGNFEISKKKHEHLLALYDHYLLVGGLPSVVEAASVGATQSEQDQIRYEIYLSQKDDFYRKTKNIKSHLFEDAVVAAASSLAYPMKLTTITNNHRDAKAILELLDEWHIVLRCPQASLSATTKLTQKVYLYDTGLARHFREAAGPALSLVNTKDAALRTALGGLVENSLYLAMLAGKGFQKRITGWKKNPKQPVEVDFIYNTDAGVALPIEVKSALKMNKRFFHSVRLYLEATKQDVGIVTSGAPYEAFEYEGKKLVNLPMYWVEPKLLEQLGSGFA